MTACPMAWARWLLPVPGGVSASLDLLATAAGLGGARHLDESLAVVSERIERAPATAVERVVSGREFCSREKKKRLRSRKNQAGQGDEVDRGGRRPQSSFGRPPSLCIPGGSLARGNHTRDD